MARRDGMAMRIFKTLMRAVPLACAMMSCAPAQPISANPPGAKKAEVFDDREIVVLVDSGRAGDSLTRQADALGYRLTQSSTLSGLGETLLVFLMPDGQTGPGAIAELEAIEPSATAGLNHVYTPQARSIPAEFDYAADLIEWPDAACTAAAPVGLIDTGVDADDLPGLAVTVATFARSTNGDLRHGTDVAALLSDPRAITGLELYNAVVVDRGPDGQSKAGVDAIVRAINWLASEDVRVVNVSLAGPFNKILNRAVERAADRGMLLIAAAGNAGPDSAPRFPAAFPDVVAVTAVDARSRVFASAVRGAHVDLAAPGVEIYIPAGSGRFASGTSLAAPFVVRRILSDPTLAAQPDADALRQKLLGQVQDIGVPGTDEVFGAGLLRMKHRCSID